MDGFFALCALPLTALSVSQLSYSLPAYEARALPVPERVTTTWREVELFGVGHVFGQELINEHQRCVNRN